MYVLVAFVALALGVTSHLGMLSLGRWIAGFPFGAKSFRDAVTWRDRPGTTRALLFARAGGGAVGWYLASALISSAGFFLTGETRIDDKSMRVTVAEGGPANLGGIRDGDRIVAVDGSPVGSWDELRSKVRTTDPLKVDVDRDGRAMSFEVVPAGVPPKILVGPPVQTTHKGAGAALAAGFVTPFDVVRGLLTGLGRTLLGREKPELSGPVGIVRETASAQKSGTGVTLRFVGAIGSYLMTIVVITLLLGAIRGRPSEPKPE
ncbi:MAG: PDZ domain-containing protein [Labilithrix sp.]|nr:PDZ domain-containing protein [Labilithrix sp.]